MCNHIFTRGANSGKKCPTKQRQGDFCSKHRQSKGKQQVVDHVVQDQHDHVDLECNDNGKCKYMYMRGANKGKQCEVHPRNGEFCSKHRPKCVKKSEVVESKVEEVKVEEVKGETCEVCSENVPKLKHVCPNSINHGMCKNCFLKLRSLKCPFCRCELKEYYKDKYRRFWLSKKPPEPSPIIPPLEFYYPPASNELRFKFNLSTPVERDRFQGYDDYMTKIEEYVKEYEDARIRAYVTWRNQVRECDMERWRIYAFENLEGFRLNLE